MLKIKKKDWLIHNYHVTPFFVFTLLRSSMFSTTRYDFWTTLWYALFRKIGFKVDIKVKYCPPEFKKLLFFKFCSKPSIYEFDKSHSFNFKCIWKSLWHVQPVFHPPQICTKHWHSSVWHSPVGRKRSTATAVVGMKLGRSRGEAAMKDLVLSCYPQ